MASAGVAGVAGVPRLPFVRVVALASAAPAAGASDADSAWLAAAVSRRSTVAASYCLRAFWSASWSLAASTWPRIFRSLARAVYVVSASGWDGIYL